MKSIRIERKTPGAARWRGAVRAAVRRAGRAPVTAADVATATGLPLAEAERGLLEVAAHVPCALGVSAEGVLRFEFAPPRGAAASAAHAFGRVRPALVRGAEVVLAVVTMMIGPLVPLALVGNTTALFHATVEHGQWWLWPLVPPAFLLALTVALFFGIAALAHAALLIGPIALGALVFGVMGWGVMPRSASDLTPGIWVAIACCLAVPGFIVWHLLGFTRREARAHIADKSWQRAAWRQVRGFVLGPARAEGSEAADALADERRLTALIRARAGVLAPLDVMLLFGWSRADADRQIARLLVDYGGEIVVDDRGAMAYVFDPMLETAAGGPAAPAAPSVDVPIAMPAPPVLAVDVALAMPAPPVLAVDVALAMPAPLFGCDPAVGVTATALMLTALTGLLVHPALVLFPDLDDLVRLAGESMPLLLMQNLGAGLALAFLAGPALRAALRPLQERAWRRRAMRLRWLRAARDPARPMPGMPPAWLRVEVGAELSVGPDDDPHCTFPQHAADDALARTLRQARTPSPAIGLSCAQP